MKKVLLLIVAICCSLGLFAQGQWGGVKGTIVNRAGRLPIAQAAITISQGGEVVAKAYIGGKEVCCDSRETTGKPVKLSLRLENSFEANGKDIALFTCECLDEKGRAVPDAEEYVSFSADGNARILGTGSDNCDHKNVTFPERQMYAGKIAVALRPNSGAEEFKLFAKSKNCGTTCFTWKK